MATTNQWRGCTEGGLGIITSYFSSHYRKFSPVIVAVLLQKSLEPTIPYTMVIGRDIRRNPSTSRWGLVAICGSSRWSPPLVTILAIVSAAPHHLPLLTVSLISPHVSFFNPQFFGLFWPSALIFGPLAGSGIS